MPYQRPSYLDAHSGGIIRVSQTTDPGKLASSIAIALQDKRNNGRIAVRYAGLEPTSIAQKAMIIASGTLFQRGRGFLRIDSFQTAQTPDGIEITILQSNLKLVTKDALDQLNAA